MAENKEEIKLVHFGDEFYKLDDLLKLHTQQEQHFYNFARERGQFDENALERLRVAIEAKINAAKAGKIFEADGGTDTDVIDNVSIQTYKDKRKKRKGITVKQGMKDWADYYIATLSSNLPVYNKQQNSGKSWDLSKHGLGAYLVGQGLSAQDVFEQYDTRDPDDPDKPRTFVQRRDLLRKYLPGYKQWLSQQGFDYTQNANDWDDNFGTDFDTFANDYATNDAYDIKDLTMALRRFGAGDAFTTAFTSNKWDLSDLLGNRTGTSTYEEEETRRKAEAERNAYNEFITGKYNLFKGYTDNDLGGKTYFTTGGDHRFEMSEEEYQTWLNTHTDNRDAYMDQLQQNYYTNPFDKTVAAEWLPLAGKFNRLKDVVIDGKNYKYDPGTIDRDKLRFVAFDPVSGEIRHAFLGDIEEEKQALRRKWRIENGYEKESDKYTISEKEGGVLTMQMGGDFSLKEAVKQDLYERNLAKSKETGNTPEVQKARDRIVSNGDQSFKSEQNSIREENAGFTGAEIARLASIGADIASLFFDPLTGTAIGVGSTLTNFGADIADDGFQWSDVKNLGINLGFDLLGAIPIFGDAVGTGGKIIKNLSKWTPRIMASLAAFQGVKNFDGMMESWSKFASGDADKKLTVQDWRNIAQSISLITGGVRATRNKVAQSKVKQQAKLDDVVGVNIRDKATGQVRQILVDGDTAKNIRAAAGDKAKIEAELGKLEVFKGKFGENGTLEVNTKNNGGLQSPIGRNTKADGSKEWELRGLRKQGKAEVSDVYDFSKIPQGYGSRPGLKIPWLSDKLNTWHHDLMTRSYNNRVVDNQRGAMTTAQVDAEVAKLQSGLDAEVAGLKKSMQARATRTSEVKQELAPSKQRLDELINKLNGVPDEATLKGSKTQLENDIITSDAKIQARQSSIAQAEADYTKLKNKKRIAKKNWKAHIKAKQKALGKFHGEKMALRREQAIRQRHQDELNKIQQNLTDRAALPEVQTKVARLENILNSLDKRNHTHSYDRVRKMVSDYQANHSNIGGRDLTWDMSDILKNAGITGAFKQGGSVNKTKLNKFLNYAKG